MEIRPIKTEDDYNETLSEVERLFDAVPDTPEGDRLEVLTTLLEAYEKKHYSILAPDPVEAIKYWMESRGITRQDLEPLMGSRARVSEIFNHKITGNTGTHSGCCPSARYDCFPFKTFFFTMPIGAASSGTSQNFSSRPAPNALPGHIPQIFHGVAKNGHGPYTRPVCIGSVRELR